MHVKERCVCLVGMDILNFGYVRKDNSNSVKSERRYEDEYIKRYFGKRR